jgi:Mrp family chromosome partitioning ATPase/capsular polysaccharide biosynthesis protein
MDFQAADKRFADYIRPLLARKWMILLAVVIATGAVYAYYSHKPKVYESSTLVYVIEQGDPLNGGNANIQQTDRQVADQATLLDSTATAALVAGKIHYPGSPGQLLQQVTMTSQPGQDFVQISAQAGTAQGAAKIANSFANEFVELVNHGYTNRVATDLRTAEARLSGLNPRSPDSGLTRSDLIAEVDNLSQTKTNPTLPARQVQPAPVPAGPSSPKPVRNALFALALSLFAAIAAAYGMERFDRRLKNPEDMEQTYARTLLAVLPHAVDPNPIRSGAAGWSSEFREPFRVLRTNVELATLDRPARTIVVSSGMPGEGKSTVVRNLALAFREAGKSVAVVDLDLRHPSQQRLFAVPNVVGVTEVLRHEVELEDALRTIQVELDPFDTFMISGARPDAVKTNGNGRATNGATKLPEIALLTTGKLPANPAAVLASDRTVEVLDALKDRFDVVIIDSAPVLAVSDSVSLLRYADISMFVGRLNVTTRDTAKRLMDVLDRVPDMLLAGIVANDLPKLEAGSYGYGAYSYGATPGRTRETPGVPEAPKEPV